LATIRPIVLRILSSLLLLIVLSAGAARVGAVPPIVCEQPLYGFAWSTREIPLFVERYPEYARNAVLAATETWNLAQSWFSASYGVPSRPYRFVEVDRLGQSYVKVSFNQTQTREDWGYTLFNYWWDSSGVFYRITVSISLDLTLWSGKSLSAQELQALATHELGHALGLGHTAFLETDLMDHLSPVRGITVPSTINLYALALLSMVSSRSNLPSSPVTLPASIPYQIPPQSAVPEISSPAIVTAVTMTIALILISTRKKSRPNTETKLGRCAKNRF
jgi:hypothetical protein